VRFAFSSNAFRQYSLVETITNLARIGYEGIEIMADAPHAFPESMSRESVETIRETLRRNGMTVSNINAFTMHAVGDTWHPSWIEPDPQKRKKRLDHTLRCLDLAVALGAETVSTEPGGPLHGMDRNEALQLFHDGLAVVWEKAKRLGLRVLIEPEPGLLIQTSSEFMDFYGGLDPTVFGLNFDVGHFFCVGEDPAALVPVLRHCAFHYHLEDIPESRVHVHTALGKGAMDIPAILQALYATGYDGFVTVELYPYQDDPIAVAEHAMAYLRGLSL